MKTPISATIGLIVAVAGVATVIADSSLGGFVLLLPFHPESVGRLSEPFWVIPQLFDLNACEIFHSAGFWMT